MSREPEITFKYVYRLLAPWVRFRLIRARWRNIYFGYLAGVKISDLAKHFGRSESTIIRLLKRAAIEEQKQPGFVWRTTADGKRICDIESPMPLGDDPQQWLHVWAKRRRIQLRLAHLPIICLGREVSKTPQQRDFGFCPVCRNGGIIWEDPKEYAVLKEHENYETILRNWQQTDYSTVGSGSASDGAKRGAEAKRSISAVIGVDYAGHRARSQS